MAMLSYTEEEARKKRAPASPMTSLTTASIQAPKPVAAPKPAPVPAVTAAPAPAPAPAVAAAPAPAPAPAPKAATPVNQGVLDMMTQAAPSGGMSTGFGTGSAGPAVTAEPNSGGGMQVVGPGDRDDEGGLALDRLLGNIGGGGHDSASDGGDRVDDAIGTGVDANEIEDASDDDAVEPPSDIDDLVEQFVRDSLDPSNSDTGDEEAYIEQRVADRLGQDLVGARASMGRAGFGSSGALYGMEGDQRRQANLDAEGRIYDVREREQDQGFDQGERGARLDIDKTEAANREAILKAQTDAINDLLGGGDEAPTDEVDDDGNPFYDDSGAQGRFGHNPDIQGTLPLPDDVDVSNAEEREFIVGQTDWYFGSDEEYDYYESQVDGKILKHRRDAWVGG